MDELQVYPPSKCFFHTNLRGICLPIPRAEASVAFLTGHTNFLNETGKSFRLKLASSSLEKQGIKSRELYDSNVINSTKIKSLLAVKTPARNSEPEQPEQPLAADGLQATGCETMRYAISNLIEELQYSMKRGHT
jgi:hypothetical protein